MVNAIEKLSLRGVPTVARCSRSKLGDSSLRPEHHAVQGFAQNDKKRTARNDSP